MIPSHIFREYDIRGLADTELTHEVALGIGRAFAALLAREGKKRISVSYDLRKSSKRIQKSLIEGLTAGGLNVLDLGMLPTPLLYFSVSHLKLDGGISITGSHNPPEFNGFKLHLADRPFYGKEIQELKKIMEADEARRAGGEKSAGGASGGNEEKVGKEGKSVKSAGAPWGKETVKNETGGAAGGEKGEKSEGEKGEEVPGGGKFSGNKDEEKSGGPRVEKNTEKTRGGSAEESAKVGAGRKKSAREAGGGSPGARALASDAMQNSAKGIAGKIEKGDIAGPYLNYVKGLFRFKRKLKVVIDAGHGMGGMVAPQLVKSLGHEVIELYTNLDPDFPDHHPDPSVPSNLKDLQKKVLETKADLGIGFDGDADRIGVVDEKGQVIFGDKILLLYARAILKKKPGATIIGDVKCSQQIYDDIAKRGGKPMMWKTGHSLIKAKMKETHAALAGEMSGHMFFVDRWFGFDDAIYAGCRMLEIVDENSEPLSRLLADLPKLVSTPELRVDCPDDKKFQIVERAVKEFQKEYDVATIDGARIRFKDGSWGLVRASNTQPVLVMRFEAASQKRLEEIQNIVESKIKTLSRAA